MGTKRTTYSEFSPLSFGEFCFEFGSVVIATIPIKIPHFLLKSVRANLTYLEEWQTSIPRVEGSIPDSACQAVTISRLLSLYVSPSRFLHTRTEPSSENRSGETKWDKKSKEIERRKKQQQQKSKTIHNKNRQQQQQQQRRNSEWDISQWRRSSRIRIKRRSRHGQYSGLFASISNSYRLCFRYNISKVALKVLSHLTTVLIRTQCIITKPAKWFSNRPCRLVCVCIYSR